MFKRQNDFCRVKNGTKQFKSCKNEANYFDRIKMTENCLEYD